MISWENVISAPAPSLSAHDVTKIQTNRVFWVSTFMIITAPKNLYLHKFLVPKGSSFCDKRRLNLQAFAWRGI